MHKLGIIGYGGMAGYHHGQAARVGDGFSVSAAFDVDPERLELARANGLKTYDTIGNFLASREFDIVLVATPNNFHCEYTIAALEAGYNVVCEKPVAMSLAELDSMIAASKRTGKLFSVHQNRRWDEDYRIVREVLKSGDLGKPYTIESRVHGQWGVVHGWRAYKVAGGGMLLDWGVHLIDQMLDMIQEPVKSVYARLISVRTEDVDDYFKLLINFESGLVAQIEVGTYCLDTMPRWYINGDAGSLRIQSWDCAGKIIKANDRVLDWEPVIVQTKAGPTRTMAPRPKETLTEKELPKVETDWADYYRNVMAAIDGRAELIVKPEQVRRVFRVIEAAFESDRTGQSVIF